MHGPITNPGAPRPHRPRSPKIVFYYNFFISTPIYFKLILSLMTLRSISTMHGPITNPGAPRPHIPRPPKIAFYYNFFISTQIHFKLILNLFYENTVNLNYAWRHYQAWGAPPIIGHTHLGHAHQKLPFTIISSFLHRFTSN